MEAIYEQLMYKDYPNVPYLDFGSSTENNCSVINAGLIAHKEGYEWSRRVLRHIRMGGLEFGMLNVEC